MLELPFDSGVERTTITPREGPRNNPFQPRTGALAPARLRVSRQAALPEQDRLRVWGHLLLREVGGLHSRPSRPRADA